MTVVVVELEPVDRQDRFEGKRAIEMREQVTAAGRLPFEGLAQPLRIDGDEQQILLPGVIFGEGARDLVSRRQMDEAIAEIVARA